MLDMLDTLDMLDSTPHELPRGNFLRGNMSKIRFLLQLLMFSLSSMDKGR